MKNLILICVLAMFFGFSAVGVAQDKAPATVKCYMKFNLKGWSVFYKTAEGSGRITCNNGENANVKINVTGGGLTFGKMDIRDGNGVSRQSLISMRFSAVTWLRKPMPVLSNRPRPPFTRRVRFRWP